MCSLLFFLSQWEMTHLKQPTWFQWGNGKQQPPNTGQWDLVLGIWNQNTEMPCVFIFLSAAVTQAWELPVAAINLPYVLKDRDSWNKPSRKAGVQRKIGTWDQKFFGPHHLPHLDSWDPTVSLYLDSVKCTSVFGFIPISDHADLWVFLL